MQKKRYEKPIMELIDFADDVIVTSNPCPPVGICIGDSCLPVGTCSDNCYGDFVPCDSGYCRTENIHNHTLG